MSATAAATKAAPTTLNQFRNFSYIVVAWLGFNKGFREKRENDALWAAHQRKVRAQTAEEQQIARAHMKAQEAQKKPQSIPDVVPEGLHDVYNSIRKEM